MQFPSSRGSTTLQTRPCSTSYPSWTRSDSSQTSDRFCRGTERHTESGQYLVKPVSTLDLCSDQDLATNLRLCNWMRQLRRGFCICSLAGSKKVRFYACVIVLCNTVRTSINYSCTKTKTKLTMLRDHYVWSSHTYARRHCKAGFALFYVIHIL